jgi:hypothetical protein
LFGSGVRVTDNTIVFVPSCALVDRLLWAERDGELVVSNSLALLLADTGWRLISGHRYERTLRAITKGIDRYDDQIPTDCGTVHQLYYHNLEVSARGRVLRHKDAPREIASYEEYVGLVTDAVKRLADNMSSSARRFRVQPIATMSRGYDSPAVCALARATGLRRCYTSPRSNSLIPSFVSRFATDDNGTVLAEALGLEARILSRSVAHELHFLAGSGTPEFVFDGLVSDIKASNEVTAVFTGYHGDMLWRLDAFDDDRATQIIRHDVSGLNLCEVRLDAGFFNVPLTFLYARSQASIGRISRAQAMNPWRTGTEYDRPIPRRLLTEAGVDGSLFGQRKKAILNRPDLPATPEMRDAFLRALKEQTGYSTPVIAGTAVLNSAMAWPAMALRRLGVRVTFVRPADIRSRLYVWALNRLASLYTARRTGRHV